MDDDWKTIVASISAAVVGIGLVMFLVFYLFIEIPRMRHETLTQQLYNRCLRETSYDQAGKNCEYILDVKPHPN